MASHTQVDMSIIWHCIWLDYTSYVVDDSASKESIVWQKVWQKVLNKGSHVQAFFRWRSRRAQTQRKMSSVSAFY